MLTNDFQVLILCLSYSITTVTKNVKTKKCSPKLISSAHKKTKSKIMSSYWINFLKAKDTFKQGASLETMFE